MKNFLVRRAEEADLPSLGRLGAMLVKAHFAFDSQRFIAPEEKIEESYAIFLRHEMTNPNAVIFVAEQDSTVVGYVYAEHEPPSWKELRDAAGFIHDVVVDESNQRSGIGAALVEAASEWLQAGGAPRIILFTAERNTAAQQLFLRLGFRRTMIEMTRERSANPKSDQ